MPEKASQKDSPSRAIISSSKGTISLKLERSNLKRGKKSIGVYERITNARGNGGSTVYKSIEMATERKVEAEDT